MARARTSLVVAAALLLLALPSAGIRSASVHRATDGRTGAAWRTSAWAFLLGVGAVASKSCAYDIFTDMDANGDGKVDRIEYMYGARDLFDAVGVEAKDRRIQLYQYTGELYDAAEMDGDGVLSHAEVKFGQYLAAQEAQLRAEATWRRSGPPDFGRAASVAIVETMDADGDGLINLTEFMPVGLIGLSVLEPLVASSRLKAQPERLFRQADCDGNGGLDWREFQYAVFLMSEFVATDLARALFEIYDQNRDGRLSSQELGLGESVRRMRQPSDVIVAAVQERFRTVDVDGDGSLDEGEVATLVREIAADM